MSLVLHKMHIFKLHSGLVVNGRSRTLSYNDVKTRACQLAGRIIDISSGDSLKYDELYVYISWAAFMPSVYSFAGGDESSEG